MTPDAQRPDVRIAGAAPAVDRPAVRRRRPLLLIAALLVTAVAVALIAVDGQRRRHEVTGLLDRVAAGRAAVDYADGRIRSTVSYSSPALLSGDVDPAVRASLRELVSQAAGSQLPDLRAERRATQAVRVLPWHGAQRDARASWVAYLDVRVAYLQGISVDFGQLFREHPELGRALSDARSAYARAAPGDAARVAQLFAGST